jgi:hypothetical protein
MRQSVLVATANAEGAGWFSDPNGRHRVRYWDGALWTTWVADYGPAFRELDAGDDVEQRFLALDTILIASVWFAGWGGIALFALTSGGTQVGLILGATWLVFAAATVRLSFVAILRPDGSLTFKGLTRTLHTTVSSVHRISHGRSEYSFYFDGKRASLAGHSGQSLAYTLLDRNPAIQDPANLRRRRGFRRRR